MNKGKKTFMEKLMELEEYCSLEDYGNYLSAKSSIISMKYYFDKKMYDEINKDDIRAIFMVDKNPKETLMKKKELKKIFSFIKIYSGNSTSIKMLIFRKEKYNSKEILEKINEMSFLKGYFKNILKITEFPLHTYILENNKILYENQDIEETFFIKKIEPKTNNQKLSQVFDYNNQMMNNNQMMKNNQIMNNNQMMNNNQKIFNNQIITNNKQMNINFISMNQLNNNNKMVMNQFTNQCALNNMLLNQMFIFYNNMMNIKNNQFQQKNLLNNSSQNNNQESKNDDINIEINNELDDFLKNNKNYDNYFPLIGLQNVGLTCYMNAILQCLLHIPELNVFFIKLYPERKNKFMKINKDCETHGKLCEEYYNIVKKVFELKNNNKVYRRYKYYNRIDSIAPKAFNNLLSNLNPQFARYESNDAKDLLLYLFQAMHSELNYFGDKRLKNVPKCNQLNESEAYKFFMIVNKSLNLSIFSHLFYGVTKSVTKCGSCQKILYNFQFIHFLSFPTFEYKYKKFNIYQGFKDFIKKEKMSGDNQCYCQNCKGLRDSFVKTKIYNPPPYLLINIDYGKNKKYIPSSVDFGMGIDIINFIDKSYKGSTQYKLISVTTHIGQSGNGGHYISYCRDSDNKWYEFNDSSVYEAKSDEIYNYTPYLLIYKKEKLE